MSSPFASPSPSLEQFSNNLPTYENVQILPIFPNVVTVWLQSTTKNPINTLCIRIGLSKVVNINPQSSKGVSIIVISNKVVVLNYFPVIKAGESMNNLKSHEGVNELNEFGDPCSRRSFGLSKQ